MESCCVDYVIVHKLTV